MDTFTAFLDYFTPAQWRIIGISGAVVIWLLTQLTNRYFDRKFKGANESTKKPH